MELVVDITATVRTAPSVMQRRDSVIVLLDGRVPTAQTVSFLFNAHPFVFVLNVHMQIL